MPSVPPRDEGFVFANRSGRSETDLGIDRSAAQVLEVAEIWSGTVVDVRHFSDDRSVTLGDRGRPTSHRLSGLLVAALVLGVGGLMVAHARLAAPPLLPAGDADRMEAWETARAEARRAVAEADSGEVEEAPRPSIEVPLDPFLDPRWEDVVRDTYLPEAERLAASGDLPSYWADYLLSVPASYDLFDDLDVPRVAGDLPMGTRVVVDGARWTVVAGRFGTLQALVDVAPVALASEDGRREIRGAEEVALWAPTDAEVAALTDLHHRIATVLFTAAEASGSPRARCRAADGLARYEDRFDLHAMRTRCFADRGEWEASAATLERAIALDPGEPTEAIGSLTVERHRELTLGMLDAAARASLVTAFPADAEVDPAAIDRAEAAHTALRDFVIGTAHDAAVLRSVDDGIHRLARHRLQEKQGVQVRRAVVLGAMILLLLPLGWRLDERRAARRGASFRVDGDALPSDPFPLVEHGAASVPVDVPASVLRDDEEVSLEDLVASGRAVVEDGLRRLTLRDDERLVARFGATTFLVHRVPAAKAVAGARSASFDTLYLGILAALLFIGASVGVHLLTSDYEVTHQFVDEIPQVTVVMLQEVEKPLEAPPAPKPVLEEPNDGDKPRDEVGRVGREDARLAVARGARTAARNAERDRSIAERAGLLPELDLILDNLKDGGGGDLERATANLGSHLIGTQYGVQQGSRGLGPGGSGPGGGGGAERLGGIGTQGIPGGGDPEAIGEWRPTKRTRAPKRDHEEIVIGEIDKSIIDRIVKQHLTQFRFCYERELQRSPDLHGKIVMKWVIAKDGSVSQSNVKRSTMNNPVVEACMVSRIRRLRFPPPRGGGIVLVSYPFVFNAR